MWNVNAKVTAVILEATKTISKSPTKYLSSIRGKHEIKELFKKNLLSTAHILWNVLV